jgi:hypothetical protein
VRLVRSCVASVPAEVDILGQGVGDDDEQSYVLEGSLEDADGVYEAGEFVWRPRGSVHHLMSPNGALLTAILGELPNVPL